MLPPAKIPGWMAIPSYFESEAMARAESDHMEEALAGHNRAIKARTERQPGDERVQISRLRQDFDGAISPAAAQTPPAS